MAKYEKHSAMCSNRLMLREMMAERCEAWEILEQSNLRLKW